MCHVDTGDAAPALTYRMAETSSSILHEPYSLRLIEVLYYHTLFTLAAGNHTAFGNHTDNQGRCNRERERIGARPDA